MLKTTLVTFPFAQRRNKSNQIDNPIIHQKSNVLFNEKKIQLSVNKVSQN